MPRSEKSSFSPERIAEFHRMQALRPVLLQQLADKIELWRLCPDKRCRRGKQCRNTQSSCFTGFMQALPDDEKRTARYAIDNRLAGLSPDEAMDKAQARVAAEMAQPEL